jgi:hypothetical protein
MSNLSYDELVKSAEKLKLQIYQDKGIKQSIQTNLDDEESAVQSYSDSKKLNNNSISLLNKSAFEKRKQSIESIERLVTAFLKSIYGDDYEFILHAKDGNYKSLTPNIRSRFKDVIMENPVKRGRGGGLFELCGFACKLAYLELTGYPGPLIIDEGFKMISADYKIDQLNKAILEYTQNTGRQFIFTTHKADVFGKNADKLILISKRNGIAVSEDITYEDYMENYHYLPDVNKVGAENEV